jgi:hypothetical protein
MLPSYKHGLEVALDLLSMAADAAAMREIENAVLHGEAGTEVRLRRLDRAHLQCRSAADEKVYREITTALERGTVVLPPEMANRLKDALGVAGFEYGFVRAITEVFEPRAL